MIPSLGRIDIDVHGNEVVGEILQHQGTRCVQQNPFSKTWTVMNHYGQDPTYKPHQSKERIHNNYEQQTIDVFLRGDEAFMHFLRKGENIHHTCRVVGVEYLNHSPRYRFLSKNPHID